MPRTPRILPVLSAKINQTNRALIKYNDGRAEEAIDKNPRAHYERYIKVLLDTNTNLELILKDLDEAVFKLVNMATKALRAKGDKQNILVGDIAKSCQRFLDGQNCRLNIIDETSKAIELRDVARGGR